MIGGMKKSNDCEWCGDPTNSPQHTICVPCAQMVEPHELPTEQELQEMAAHFELTGDILASEEELDYYDQFDHLGDG